MPVPLALFVTCGAATARQLVAHALAGGPSPGVRPALQGVDEAFGAHCRDRVFDAGFEDAADA